MNTVISLDINVFREADHLRIEKSTTTKQLDAFYSTHKAIIDDDILQAQYDLLGEEEWEW
jgi:hypothetical protein